MGWRNGVGMTHLGSGNNFILVLVSFGRKQPWETEQKQNPHSQGEGKSTGLHPRGTCPVDVLVTFWRMVQRPELLDIHLLRVPAVRLAGLPGGAK